MLFDIHKEGWIEVICGPMFAGKTEELIRRVHRLEYAKKNYKVFKPLLDNRYDKINVVSHSGINMGAIAVASPRDILAYIDHTVEAVAIDEIQFFNDDIVLICEYLAMNGTRVVVSGLDMDFRGEPFSVMEKLLVRGEFVTKLTAICMQCGAPATKTQRLINGKAAAFADPIILVGAAESYEARCRHCHEVINRPNILAQLKES
ncbi:MAG: thymidine kinase [Culicoidibacterales bacterium]